MLLDRDIVFLFVETKTCWFVFPSNNTSLGLWPVLLALDFTCDKPELSIYQLSIIRTIKTPCASTKLLVQAQQYAVTVLIFLDPIVMNFPTGTVNKLANEWCAIVLACTHTHQYLSRCTIITYAKFYMIS